MPSLLGGFFCFVFASLCFLFVAFSYLAPREFAAFLPRRISHAVPRFTLRICKVFRAEGSHFYSVCGGGGERVGVSEAIGSLPPSRSAALLCRALAGCAINRAGGELNLCKAHQAGGSCELLPNRSRAAGITTETSSKSERKAGILAGRLRIAEPPPPPLGVSAPAGGRWTTSAGPGRCGCSCSWHCCRQLSAAKIFQWKNAVTRVLNGQTKTEYVLLYH